MITIVTISTLDKLLYKAFISFLNCSQDEFNRAQNIISILNPSPALIYNSKNAEHIIPDIIISFNSCLTKYEIFWSNFVSK